MFKIFLIKKEDTVFMLPLLHMMILRLQFQLSLSMVVMVQVGTHKWYT